MEIKEFYNEFISRFNCHKRFKKINKRNEVKQV